MRDDAFRQFLMACSYTDGSVSSRLSRCRTVERRLRIDLDHAVLDGAGVLALKEALERNGMIEPMLANHLNAIRTYARFREGRPRQTAGSSAATTVFPAASVNPRPPFVIGASTPELMRLYADVLAELRSRDVIRTDNAPVGDYAELLVSRALGLALNDNSAAGFDAEDTDGVRYQIKGRKGCNARGGRQLGALRRLPDHCFDFLAAVLFDADMTIIKAALVPYDAVTSEATYVAHTNSWRLVLSDRVLALPSIIDVTEAIRDTAMTL